MRALITGGGFVGQWLARELLARGAVVHVAGLTPPAEGPSALLDASQRGKVRWTAADFRVGAAVDRAVEESRPDVVFHLAGVSYPPEADRHPEMTFDVNALGVVRLIEALERRRGAAGGHREPVLVVVGSGVQYGRHDDSEMPLSESAELRPLTVYGASKAAQEVIALQAYRRSGLRVICTRSFNHSGVGHASEYLLPSLVARARRIRRGDERVLTLGNNVVRDYLHVADVVTAYLSLAERGRPGEVYNVASGRGVTTYGLAEAVLQRAGVTAEISTEPELVRATDIPTLIGSPAKLQRDTGWKPTRTYADIIDDLLHAEAD